jgi:hypothetical protein
VIILAMARSGSTLLRFILDSHPELACPPETGLGSASFAVARLCDLLDPSPESAEGDYRPLQVAASLTSSAAASIRRLLDDAYGRYLERLGKRRWCDKSLDNLRAAELLANLYPDAQFVCLYRHCMDVIISTFEACPWGLGGYGVDQYLAASQGNGVAAVAQSWLDRARALIEFEITYPGRCHGIRYEDLVSSPEETAAELFAFLGVDCVPGITATCFADQHETRGVGDHKIWFTGGINRDSLGQGARVPVSMLPPPLIGAVNQTLVQLRYRQVDEHWAATVGACDPRSGPVPAAIRGRVPSAAGPAADKAAVTGAATTESVAAERVAAERAGSDAAAAATAISARLTAFLGRAAADLASSWSASVGQRLTIVVAPPRDDGKAHAWAVSHQDSGVAIQADADPDDAETVIAATGATWLAIMAGRVNLAAELRAGRLRLAGSAQGQRFNLTGSPPPWELHVVGHLLGLTGDPADGSA